MNNEEIWRDVVGYQGLYQVSNLGRVKAMVYANRYGTFKRQKILRPHLTIRKNKNRDYIKHLIGLSKGGTRKDFYIHRLVWTAFNGEIPQGYQIDHIDNNPENNRLDNLQLLTSSENKRKIFLDNPNYKNNGGAKPKSIVCLNNGIVYKSLRQAARCLGLSAGNIWSVLNGKAKHTGGYSFVYLDYSLNVKENNLV